ncbi:hypothetical protein [Streptomyces lasiicapitis]|uniref:hypothetical protein n=1 Tax=Streptomyces lasiicapitis TaxID=1923961 RepID=UPI0036B92B2B
MGGKRSRGITQGSARRALHEWVDACLALPPGSSTPRLLQPFLACAQGQWAR